MLGDSGRKLEEKFTFGRFLSDLTFVCRQSFPDRQCCCPGRRFVKFLTHLSLLILLLQLTAVSVAQQPPSTDVTPLIAPDALATEVDLSVDLPEPSSPEDDLRSEIQALQERLTKLEAKPAPKAAEKDKDKKKDAEPSFDWGVPKENRKWDVKLGGHVQLDYINWAQASESIPDTKDYFEFRRLRLVADGKGYGFYDFRLQMTLEPETVGESPAGTVTSPDIKDAYFSINELPYIGRARIGNFFVPFGLEQVTNDTNNVFLERSIPTQGVFTADREVGVAFYNCTEDEMLTWSGGIFLDSISEGLKERIDDNQGYRLSGRVTGLPYYEDEGRYLWHVGAGVLFTDDQDGRYRIRSRPQIHEGPRIIDSGVIPVDTYVTGNLETAIVCGPFSVQSEAYLSQVDFTDQSREYVHGWYVHGSFFLTGEHRNFEKFGQHGAQFGRSVPNNTVYATNCSRGWGAWELKARHSNLNLESINAGTYNDITIGLNWYWSDRVRIMFDYIHPITNSEAIYGATNSDILGTRFDFNW